MKKLTFILIAFLCVMPIVSQAAVNVKKAASVSAKKTDAMASATSLVPTVVGLVQGVKNLQQQQQALSAECAPTSEEINFVNDLVKEWAKTGEVSAKTAVSGLGNDKCNSSDAYKSFMELSDSGVECYETFNEKEYIWYNFPKASKAEICDSDNKNCRTVSNIYRVLNKVTFSNEDYTKKEAQKVAALKEKAAKCSDDKINAAKRELYGGFLTQTLNGVGQTTGAAGTASVLEAVSSMGGSGDIKSLLPSLGQMATQVMDK